MELQITAIKNGIVIDHIPSDKTFKIFKILNLREYQQPVSVAINLKSNQLGKKGLIKIENRIIDKEELNVIALLAPNVTINYIKNYKVSEKVLIHIPDEIINLLRCSNNNCISNHEKIDSKFKTKSSELFQCVYCEKMMSNEELILK